MIKFTTLIFLLSSCVGGVDYTATAPGGGTERMHVVGLFGGSETFETAGGTRWTANRNKSFGQGAQALAVAAGGALNLGITKSNNLLKGTQSTNAAGVSKAKIAADSAAKTAALEAAAKSEATAAQAGILNNNPQVLKPASVTPNAP